jgi:nucleoside-diphosphate-sugar epimerase
MALLGLALLGMASVLHDEKILLTGPAGQIAFPIAEHLARENEVWGIARFGDSAGRRRVEDLGVTTRVGDLGDGEFGDLPTDFTYLLHLAAAFDPSEDIDRAIRVNAEGTGLLLQHCRSVKAALIMSTSSVYRPNDDPEHPFVEEDPLSGAVTPWAPTYSASKLAQEAVARACARSLEVPVVIARMNAAYGPNGGLPVQHLAAIRAGKPVVTRWDPCPYTPIFQDDINDQVEPLLAAAGVPATVVNWGGDETVTVQQWSEHLGTLVGTAAEVVVGEQPGSHRGMVSDPTRRLAITGPCRVGWRQGLRRVVAAT